MWKNLEDNDQLTGFYSGATLAFSDFNIPNEIADLLEIDILIRLSYGRVFHFFIPRLGFKWSTQSNKEI